MRFALAFLLTLVLSYLSGLVFPWWIIALVGLSVGYLINMTPSKSFFAGFLACFILWAGIAFYTDIANEHILATRVGALFTLKQPILMVLITGFIGGLVTGMASLTGALLRKGLKRLTAA
ncbi:hypothetical protein [Flavitalea sp.]|nr:hypothetical protein [Flavitalea sp.]